MLEPPDARLERLELWRRLSLLRRQGSLAGDEARLPLGECVAVCGELCARLHERLLRQAQLLELRLRTRVVVLVVRLVLALREGRLALGERGLARRQLLRPAVQLGGRCRQARCSRFECSLTSCQSIRVWLRFLRPPGRRGCELALPLGQRRPERRELESKGFELRLRGVALRGTRRLCLGQAQPDNLKASAASLEPLLAPLHPRQRLLELTLSYLHMRDPLGER